VRSAGHRATVSLTVALLAAPLVVSGLPLAGRAAASEQQQSTDVEVQLGQEVFDELKAKGMIVAGSPLYDTLKPLEAQIVRVAQPRYEHPFRFYLVHMAQPNAFSTPGGNVYVGDALLFFVKNREELAGTLCHEVAHTIHHDTVTLMEKREQLLLKSLGAVVLLGPTRAHLLALALLGKLNSLGYSREVESRADLTGADICAAAGLNPWGLVWLFKDFQDAQVGQAPELLADHPNNVHRIQALEEYFKKAPNVFGKFNPDPRSATQMKLPADTAETFLR